jgi:protein TonB
MTHLFALWLALFAAQATTPAAPSTQPPAARPAQPAPTTPTDQASPTPNTNASPTLKVGGGVSAPRILHQPDPIFSVEQPDLPRITCVTVVQTIVDELGKPENVHVTKSSADTVDPTYRSFALTLDQKAVDAVKKYRFKPATKDGKPIAVILNVNVNFQIN